MIIIHHSTYDQSTIGDGLGAAEYSYWFVRKAFLPILRKFGTPIPVSDVDREAKEICRSAQMHNTPCILFSFNPPRYTPTQLNCPVIPVFAWEFDRLPDESWNDNPHEDWRIPLAKTGIAITHSSEAARVTRSQMGEDYPIWTIPAPVFERGVAHSGSARGIQRHTEIILDGGAAIEARSGDLDLFRADRAHVDGERALRVLQHVASDRGRQAQRLRFDGIVYTSVFNPGDGRKNWDYMISGFIWAFRKCPDAILILKLTMTDIVDAMLGLLTHISRLGDFACRVIIIHGLLSEEAYAGLIDATSFALNTSQGEGQCLPLMEFMAAGRPAIAPRHTAMLDYVDDEGSFVIASHQRPGFWPHDERQAHRCLRHQIEFDSLVYRLRESYAVAQNDPARYAKMSKAAVAAQKAFCSEDLVKMRLAEVFAHVGRSSHVESTHDQDCDDIGRRSLSARAIL